MTRFTEFDRVLGDWLAEGPTRAPEHPVEMAVQHAQAHPRRWDPIAALRRDAMATPGGFGAGLVGRPVLVLASAGLLLAAVAAGALIGSQGDDPVVVPPVTTPSPTPSSPQPSIEPVRVDLEEIAGNDATIDVVDLSGSLLEAVSGTPGEGATVEGIVAANDDADTVRLTWAGSPCDTVHRLTIDAAGNTFTLERPRCAGDAVSRDLVLILSFDGSVDAAGLQVSIDEGSGNGLPNWHVDGLDSAGNRVDIDVFDGSGGLVSAESFSEGGAGASVEPGSVAISNEGPATLRLVWASSACHDGAQVGIADDLSLIEVEEVACTGDAVAFDRVLILGFDRPVDAATVGTAWMEVVPD